MEITESTRDRLVLQEKQPILWRMIGLGTAFFSGLFAAVELGPDSVLADFGGWILPLIVGLIIFCVVGGLWLIGTGDIHCTLDKARNRMTLSRGGFIPLIQGAGSAECRLKEISAVVVEEEWEEEETDDDGRVTMPRHRVYRLAFELTSGKRIPLTLYYGAEHRSKAELAGQIRQFLFFTDYKPKLRRLTS